MAKRTVSVAGNCFALPFKPQGCWVVDNEDHKVAEAGTERTAVWLARVLNDHLFEDNE